MDSRTRTLDRPRRRSNEFVPLEASHTRRKPYGFGGVPRSISVRGPFALWAHPLLFLLVSPLVSPLMSTRLRDKTPPRPPRTCPTNPITALGGPTPPLNTKSIGSSRRRPSESAFPCRQGKETAPWPGHGPPRWGSSATCWAPWSWPSRRLSPSRPRLPFTPQLALPSSRAPIAKENTRTAPSPPSLHAWTSSMHTRRASRGLPEAPLPPNPRAKAFRWRRRWPVPKRTSKNFAQRARRPGRSRDQATTEHADGTTARGRSGPVIAPAIHPAIDPVNTRGVDPKRENRARPRAAACCGLL